MRNLVRLIAVAMFIVATLGPAPAPAADVAAYFSPNGGCSAAAAAAIDSATVSIDVATYQLTSAPLLAALERAAARGLPVRIIVDRANEGRAAQGINRLIKAGATVRTDDQEKLFHNKVGIIDARRVITGSFNWSNNADRHNAENLLIITDEPTAAAYAADFNTHWAHARGFAPRDPNPKHATRPSPRLFISTEPAHD